MLKLGKIKRKSEFIIGGIRTISTDMFEAVCPLCCAVCNVEIPASNDALCPQCWQGLRENVQQPACPTCGRTGIDLFSLAQEVENYIQTMKSPLKVAVMGCVVNGPGEAREADIGVAGGRGKGIIFKKGEIIRRVAENELLDVFMGELKKMEAERLQDQKQENNN